MAGHRAVVQIAIMTDKTRIASAAGQVDKLHILARDWPGGHLATNASPADATRSVDLNSNFN